MNKQKIILLINENCNKICEIDNQIIQGKLKFHLKVIKTLLIMEIIIFKKLYF